MRSPLLQLWPDPGLVDEQGCSAVLARCCCYLAAVHSHSTALLQLTQLGWSAEQEMCCLALLRASEWEQRPQGPV